MVLGSLAHHPGRYRDLVRLLVRYGRSDLVRGSELESALGGEPDPEQVAGAEQLAADLEALGPTYVKLGQLLSTRTDLLPPAYTAALSRLQDAVEPLPFAEVERTLLDELDVRLSRAFDDIDPQPLAAASLGQVHRAVLRGGTPVAVKVQRPDARARVTADLEVLEDVARLLDRHSESARRFGAAEILARFRRSLTDELDYRQEAANLRRLGEMLADRPRLVVPQPHPDFSTGRVLTMDFVRGRKVTDLGPLGQLELDGAGLARELFDGYLDQILVAGFFHADPHPGNVLVTDDGRLALVDLGMVARVPPAMRDTLIRLLLALTEGRGEEVARLAEQVATPLEDYDRRAFQSEVAEVVARTAGLAVGEVEVGAVLLEFTRICGARGLRPAAELSLVGKALLNLDLVADRLDPHFQPNAAVQDHAMRLLRQGMRPSLSSLVGSLMDAREFAEQLPGRVNRVMDALGEGRFELRVHAFDETEMLRGLQQVANRIATGMVLAALIVGAALLGGTRTGPRILGYSAVAFVLFCVAALGGAGLLLRITFGDRRARSRVGRTPRS